MASLTIYPQVALTTVEPLREESSQGRTAPEPHWQPPGCEHRKSPVTYGTPASGAPAGSCCSDTPQPTAS